MGSVLISFNVGAIDVDGLTLRQDDTSNLWFNYVGGFTWLSNISTFYSRHKLLLDEHFHKEHKLGKIFNRNSVKESYCCTRNIEHIIKNHDRKINESYIEKSAETSRNCKEKKRCPLDVNFLIKNIVYMATARTETNASSYVGMKNENENA